MKKVKLYTLTLLYVAVATIEFVWSVFVAVWEAIGNKLTELTDTVEAELKKAKS